MDGGRLEVRRRDRWGRTPVEEARHFHRTDCIVELIRAASNASNSRKRGLSGSTGGVADEVEAEEDWLGRMHTAVMGSKKKKRSIVSRTTMLVGHGLGGGGRRKSRLMSCVARVRDSRRDSMAVMAAREQSRSKSAILSSRRQSTPCYHPELVGGVHQQDSKKRISILIPTHGSSGEEEESGEGVTNIVICDYTQPTKSALVDDDGDSSSEDDDNNIIHHQQPGPSSLPIILPISPASSAADTWFSPSASSSCTLQSNGGALVSGNGDGNSLDRAGSVPQQHRIYQQHRHLSTVQWAQRKKGFKLERANYCDEEEDEEVVDGVESNGGMTAAYRDGYGGDDNEEEDDIHTLRQKYVNMCLFGEKGTN